MFSTVCGWLSEWFPTECGVRQGCPFSPLFFILGVELLAIKIRQSSDISGITLTCFNNTDHVVKIQQYADYVTLFVSNPLHVTNALSLVNQFSKLSGLQINATKGKGIWLRAKPPYGHSDQIRWCSKDETVKILGVHFSGSKAAGEIDLNWVDKINILIKAIKHWEKRSLNIMGKIIVAKTFLISKCIYLLQGLSLPLDMLKHIDQILYEFVWKRQFNEKKAFEKVQRVVVNANTTNRVGLKW